MSAGFLRRSSTPTGNGNNNLTTTTSSSTSKPTDGDQSTTTATNETDEEWQLKVAMELSAKSYEMEKTRRRSSSVSPQVTTENLPPPRIPPRLNVAGAAASSSSSTTETSSTMVPMDDGMIKDLIDLEDPRLVERKKKIEEIKELQRRMDGSKNHVRNTAPMVVGGGGGGSSLSSASPSSGTTASAFFQSWNTTVVSGGGRAYGISKTTSTPTFKPYVNFSRSDQPPPPPSDRSSSSSVATNAGPTAPSSSYQNPVKWRTRSTKEETGAPHPFRLPPPPPPPKTSSSIVAPPGSSSTLGTAAVYWRKNNNLVIPYVKSIIFDNPSDEDNLIQFVQTDSAGGTISSEELLKIFDPLFEKPPPPPPPPAVVEEEQSKVRPISSSSETASSGSTAAAAVVARKGSTTADVRHSRSSVVEIEKRKSSSTESARILSASNQRALQQQQAAAATSWDDIRLVDHSSPIERQVRRLCELVVSIENSSSEEVNAWRDVIIARRVTYPSPSVTDVMLVIRMNSAASSAVAPLKFTCDVASSVDQVLETVLFSTDLHTKEQKYALKVFGRDEYLLPGSLLSDYAYIHNSIKMGKDIVLQLDPAPKEKAATPTFDVTGLASESYASAVRKDVEVIIHTIKSVLRRIQESTRSGGLVQSTPAIQALKALCVQLHNVETVDLCSAISKFSAACDALSGTSKRSYYGSGNDEFRKSAEYAADLERSIEMLATAVHGLLAAYCRSSNVSFAPAPIDRRQSPPTAGDRKEFVDMEDSFLFHIGSVHNLQQEWLSSFAKFYVAAYVFHGVNEVFKKERVALANKEQGLYPFLKVDSWVTFDNSRLCTLPREARLCVVLYGVRVETNDGADLGSSMKSIVEVQIGWGCMPLFDSENCLLQGTYLVPMMLDSTIQPWGPPSYIGDVNRYSPVLALTLPTFDQEIRFPDVPLAPLRSSCVFEQLDTDTRLALEGIFESAANVKDLARDEKDLLWEMRLYLTKRPEALPLVLASAFSWDCLFLSHVYQLLNVWTGLETAQAIELLLPRFADQKVRKHAVDSVKRSGADDLLGFLPQFVEALQFELYEDSALAQLLLQFAKENRRFAFALFWLLEERKGTSLYGCRCRLLQTVMLRLLGDSVVKEIEAQLRLTNRTDSVATDLKGSRDEDRQIVVRSNLERLDSYLLEHHVRLPLNPSVIAVGIDLAKSTYFNSMTVPMKIVYRSFSSSFEVLHKIGDDLRQDALVMQMIRLMNDVWLKEGLDLRIITFHCLPTGKCRGMIEMVTDSKTLREITDEGGGVTGVLREDLTWRWIQKHNSSELDYEMALKNFRLSCAGWCVATYVLGIGDRHNDNVLVTSRGHMLHIDFGKYLGDTQTFGGFRRDRTPFLLTNDLVNVINAGDTKATAHFQEFVDNCCLAFNILRKHSSLFVNLMKLMVCSGIPGLSMDAVEYISQNFCMGYSESKASEYFTRMIEETMKSSFPKWNFLVHALAQQRKPAPSSNTDQLLSFVPHRYTEETDGRIISIDVLECQKWHMPEKIYMYKVQVFREHVKDPFHIYRSYKEFCEFYGLLCLRFPLVKLYGLSRSQNLGRTNIREVAERRRFEISQFLELLFRSTSECDLVYTFFHSTFRDQETDSNARDAAPRLQPGTITTVGGGEIRGDIRVALEYRQEKLEVFISHVRDLAAGISGAAPEVYVKCYIRPGHSVASKRKTRLVKAQNPTFNETLDYKEPLAYFVGKQLEVTVWRRDVLKENSFLGGVLIPLDSLGRQKVARWYKLENIRRGLW